jgi:3-deoxy-D-manno-octulosonic-acid transferase
LIPLAVFLRRERVADRLALRLPNASFRPGSIWIHALSVGEVVSAVPLVKALLESSPDNRLVFTVTTSNGMEVAQQSLPRRVGTLLTMPVDIWWSVRRIADYLRPAVFVLVETDIWPGLNNLLGKRGIRRILVNGRVSPRTFRAYSRFPWLARILFNRLDLCLMQTDQDRDRLLRVGIPRDKVVTAGNMKFDREWTPMAPGEKRQWLHRLNLSTDNLIWVAGSTHAGEEEILLEIFTRLRKNYRQLRLILAPRKIERAANICRLATDVGCKAVLRSGIEKQTNGYEVLVLDTLGELERIYGIARVSFVGGSLVQFGGHNLLEPASLGCPVLFGPHMHNFVLMSELIVEAQGGWRVEDGEDLFRAMDQLLAEDELCKSLGRKARTFVEGNQGALHRIVARIEGMKNSGERFDSPRGGPSDN